MAHDFSDHHGAAAFKIIIATVIAVIVVLPVVNALFGKFLPQSTVTV